MAPEKLLRRALKQAGWTQGKLARELELDSSAVSRLLNGGRRPNLSLAFKIEKILKVPAKAWVKSE